MSASMAKPVTSETRIKNGLTLSNMVVEGVRVVSRMVALSLKVTLLAAAQSRAYHSANWDWSTQSHTKFESQDLRADRAKRLRCGVSTLGTNY